MSELESLAEGLADENPAVREDCARALAELGDPNAVPFLVHALDDDEEQVRMWGAYGLGMLEDRAHRELLQQAAKEPEAPLLHVWANFALARTGDAAAVTSLVRALEHQTPAVRANAGDALMSLDRPEVLKKALAPAFTGAHPAAQLWAAALLHKLDDPRALPAWRHGLGEPALRVDAAISATYMEDAAVARDLLRLVGELSSEELEQQVSEDGALLAEVLTQPLLELPLDEVIEQASTDLAARADLMLFLARSPGADPELFDRIQQFVVGLDPSTQGAALAELLSEQDESARPALLSNFASFSPPAIAPALRALPDADRKKILDRAIASVRDDDEESPVFFPLIDALREGPYASLVKDLTTGASAADATDPDAPVVDGPDEDDHLASIIRRIVAKEEVTAAQEKEADTFLKQLGMTATEYLEEIDRELDVLADAPPDPVEVARRALALGGMLRRLHLEEELKKTPAQKSALQKPLESLHRWMDDHDFSLLLSDGEVELIYAGLGDWNAEELEVAGWVSEECAVLLWSLGRLPTFPAEDRCDGRALVKELPIGEPPDAFAETARLRPGPELDGRFAFWSAFKARAEQEALARHIKAEGLEGTGLEADSLLADVAADGFDRKSAEKAHGKNGAVAEALRFVGRLMAKEAEDEGLLRRAGDDFPFRGKPISAARDQDLAFAVAIADERYRAIRWLLTGSAIDEDTESSDEDEQAPEGGG